MKTFYPHGEMREMPGENHEQGWVCYDDVAQEITRLRLELGAAKRKIKEMEDFIWDCAEHEGAEGWSEGMHEHMRELIGPRDTLSW